MDPYKLLDLPKNFNLPMLREHYRTMALKTHPDRSHLGSDYLFKLVTAAYKTLLVELKKREEEPSFNDLKSGSKTYTTKQQEARPITSLNVGSGNGFNVNQFNQVFEENKLDDVHESTGYGSFMAQSSAEREELKIENNFGGKFNHDKFNKAFDKLPSEKGKKVVIYKEPEAMSSSKNMAFAELGLAKISDFSGDNMDSKKIQYSDYKIAHTTSRLVDPSSLKQRKEYSSVKDLEADRGNISYQLSEKDKKEIAKKQAKEEAQERRRKEQIKQHDELVSNQYEKLNKLLLGR